MKNKVQKTNLKCTKSNDKIRTVIGHSPVYDSSLIYDHSFKNMLSMSSTKALDRSVVIIMTAI